MPFRLFRLLYTYQYVWDYSFPPSNHRSLLFAVVVPLLLVAILHLGITVAWYSISLFDSLVLLEELTRVRQLFSNMLLLEYTWGLASDTSTH
mgnify:CR=1 FL=1|jgi:hypothetical protein